MMGALDRVRYLSARRPRTIQVLIELWKELDDLFSV